jgi:hypothetical protein
MALLTCVAPLVGQALLVDLEDGEHLLLVGRWSDKGVWF